MTKKVLIFLSCSACNISFIRGYIIGSPTKESAQCFTLKASTSLSGWTPVCERERNRVRVWVCVCVRVCVSKGLVRCGGEGVV